MTTETATDADFMNATNIERVRRALRPYPLPLSYQDAEKVGYRLMMGYGFQPKDPRVLPPTALRARLALSTHGKAVTPEFVLELLQDLGFMHDSERGASSFMEDENIADPPENVIIGVRMYIDEQIRVNWVDTSEPTYPYERERPKWFEHLAARMDSHARGTAPNVIRLDLLRDLLQSDWETRVDEVDTKFYADAKRHLTALLLG